MKYYKLLDDTGVSNYIKWNIAGDWMKANKEIIGFQVFPASGLVYHIGDGYNLYEVVIEGKGLIGYNSVLTEYVRVVKQVSGYTRESLLSKVVFPAIDRAQKYAHKTYSTSAYATSIEYAQWAKEEADFAEAVISLSVFARCAELALRYSARAADDHRYNNIWNTGSERKIQIEAILQLLNNA